MAAGDAVLDHDRVGQPFLRCHFFSTTNAVRASTDRDQRDVRKAGPEIGQVERQPRPDEIACGRSRRTSARVRVLGDRPHHVHAIIPWPSGARALADLRSSASRFAASMAACAQPPGPRHEIGMMAAQ